MEGIKDFFFPGSHFYITVVSQSLGIFIKISEFFLSNLDIFVFLFLSMLSCSLQFPISSQFKTFLSSHGTLQIHSRIEWCCRWKHRHMLDIARTLLHSSFVSISFPGEAIHFSLYFSLLIPSHHLFSMA